MEITKIEPLSWFVGTKSKELQLLVYGEGMNGTSIDVGIPYSKICFGKFYHLAIDN